jgi:hypothetical protein
MTAMTEEWDPNDRRGWRYTIGGRPVELAQLFVDRLCGRNQLEVSNVCTNRSRPVWERFFEDEWKAEEWIQKALACSTTVRHPAPGMAFVFFLLTHPDQTEAFTIDRETLASAEALTLVYDQAIHDWRVHPMGAMGPPSDLGLVAFPRE